MWAPRTRWAPRTCLPGSSGHPVLVDEVIHVHQKQSRHFTVIDGKIDEIDILLDPARLDCLELSARPPAGASGNSGHLVIGRLPGGSDTEMVAVLLPWSA